VQNIFVQLKVPIVAQTNFVQLKVPIVAKFVCLAEGTNRSEIFGYICWVQMKVPIVARFSATTISSSICFLQQSIFVQQQKCSARDIGARRY